MWKREEVGKYPMVYNVWEFFIEILKMFLI